MWHVIHPNEQIAIYKINKTNYMCPDCRTGSVLNLKFEHILTDKICRIEFPVKCIAFFKDIAETSTKTRIKHQIFFRKHILGVRFSCSCFIAFHNVTLNGEKNVPEYEISTQVTYTCQLYVWQRMKNNLKHCCCSSVYKCFI